MPNTTPKLNGEIPDQDVPTKAPFSLDLSTFFVDDDGDTLGYHIKTTSGLEQLPAWLSFDNKTGLLRGTPVKTDVDNIDLTVMAYDDLNSIVSDDFRLTVTHENVEPVLVTPIADQLSDPRNNFSFNVASSFADPDADALTYTASIESLKVGAVSTVTFQSGLDTSTLLTLKINGIEIAEVDGAGANNVSQAVGLANEFEKESVDSPDYEVDSKWEQLIITTKAKGDQLRPLAIELIPTSGGLKVPFIVDNQPGKSLPDWLHMNSATGVLTIAPLESSPYSLTSTFVTGTNHLYEVESNETTSTANDIISGSTITGQLSTQSDSDFYKLAVTGAGSLKLQLDVPTNSANRDFFSLSLLESTGVPLGLSQFKTGADKTYLVDVPKTGTYYIAVQAEAYDSGQYDLTSTYLADSKHLVESGSNDTRSTANVITSGSTVTGTLSTVSDVDYYALEVFGAGSLSLQFDVPTDANNKGYFNLSLYNSAGTVLSQFNTGADNIYTVGLPSPGYYYLGVSGGEYLYESQEGSYKVDITATDPSGLSISEPESFNLLLWAAEIGKINKQPILVSPIPDQVLNSAIDSPYRLDVSSHFSDNDQLNYSLSIDSTSYTDPNILNDLADNSLPDWLFFDASSGVFTGDSGQVNMGEIHFKVTASDVSGLTVSDSFALQIKNKQESIVNTRTNGNQTQAVVSFIADEQYLITWLGSNEEGEIAVFGQFYENGIKIGSEFLVDNETSNRNKKSNTSTLDNGNKVVVEQSPRDDGYYKISGQFYSNTGDKISTNFEISADSAFNQYSPTVVSLPESEFVVAWHADNEKNESNIVAQRFNGDGDIIGRNIINGTAANDVLRGTTFDDEILCFAGQDSISSSLGNDYVNGGAGVDTYIYSKAKGDFSLKGGTGESSQRWQITTDDKTDNLVNIERLFFSDTKVALDLDGNAGFVAKIISVLFGASFVTNKKFVGEALSLLDTEEGSQNELISTILNMQGFSLDEHTTNDRLYQSLVATLWDNAVSGDYTPELAKPFIEKLNEGSLSMVEIVNLAANTDYNKTAIDFTGLMTSGIEYL